MGQKLRSKKVQDKFFDKRHVFQENSLYPEINKKYLVFGSKMGVNLYTGSTYTWVNKKEFW